MCLGGAVPTEGVFREVLALIREERRRRLRTFRTCSLCGEHNPPEWMHDARVCQGCASSKLGILY